MSSGRIENTTTSLDAGTRETFKKIKQVDSFERVLENLRKYPLKNTNFLLKYIFLEGVNDNEADIDGFYEIAKDIGGIIMLCANLNTPYTDKMKDLALRILKKAKAEGVRINSHSAYLAPEDKKFIQESYANA